jgi:hypothetical protein
MFQMSPSERFVGFGAAHVEVTLPEYVTLW